MSGFNPWQRRISIVAVSSALISVLGGVASWPLLVLAGFALTLSSIVMLIMLGNRQNWRQLRSLQKQHVQKTTEVEVKTPRNHSRTTKAIPRVGATYEHIHRIKARRSDYETFALRSRSLLIRDSFAYTATNNQLNYADLTRLVAVQRIGMLETLTKSDTKGWNHTAFLALARIQTNQRAIEGDLENAIKYFEFARSVLAAAFRPTDRLLYLEALGELHRFDEQARLAATFKISQQYPIQASLMELNAIRAQSGATSPAWVHHLNKIYFDRNFATVSMTSDTERTPLDRLRTQSTSLEDGPLVSVVIPTYQGGPGLITAVNSLLQQSWKNLEIIIVDDSSGPEYQKYLDQAASISSRVKVLKLPQNQGAYCARNAGVEAATGDYITVHDDDDWSHSDKIATQVLYLINNPKTPGNMSGHVRATEQLKFLRINNKPVLTQLNFSSLMVHSSTFDKIGVWDEVNRGADSEFRDRLEKYYGQPIAVLDEVPLGFTRTREGSLTSGEVSRGYVAPNRRLYLKAFTQWHDIAGATATSLKPSQKRNYPVPSSMQPGMRNKDLGLFDIVFMTDFRFPGGTTALTLKEIKAAAAAGYRVGYIHEESPTNRSDSPVSQDLFDLQLQGVVEQVALQDSAQIRFLIARHPVVVQFLDNTTTSLRVDQSAIIVNNPPVLQGGSGMVFDLQSCIHNMDRLFGKSCMVIAESAVTKRLCDGLIPSARISDITWPGLIEPLGRNEPNFSMPPSLGRHSRDHELKWPSSKSDFDAVYTSAEYSTLLLGGAESLTEKLGSDVLENKTVYAFGAMHVQDFLDKVDFWAYFHDERLTESFGMAIAEAMAAGKVVILPPYLSATFGDGAVYAKPKEVQNVISEIWSDPSAYQLQAQRAIAYIRENFSERAFLNRLQFLMSQKT